MSKKAGAPAQKRAPRKAREARVAQELRRYMPRLMSEDEITFLRDVQGFIEFAIRNGLTFQSVVSTLLGDFNEITRDGFDYAKTLSRGFQPKVSGYADLTSEDFGETEEEP